MTPDGINPEELWKKLEERKRLLRISWQHVSRETGVSISTLYRLRNMGSLRQDTRNTLTQWLRNSEGRDIPRKNLRAFTGRPEA